MPSIAHGRNNIIRQISEKIETDRFGVDTCQITVQMPDSLFPASVAGYYSSHPDFSNLLMTKRSITRSHPGFWEVVYTFEGFIFSMPDPVYELTATLDQEPIQCHPDFVSKIAGTPSDPHNGAIFVNPEDELPTRDDSQGVFREFKSLISGSIINRKGGIESYMVPGAEWKVTSFSLTRPTALRDLGKIDSPDGDNPTLSGRNWLLWSQSYTRRGSIYQINTIWKLSGPNGWDEDIYGT